MIGTYVTFLKNLGIKLYDFLKEDPSEKSIE